MAKKSVIIIGIFILFSLFCTKQQQKKTLKLWEWEKGFAVESTNQKDMVMYFWFYEWNMFDAMEKGEHTSGTYHNQRTLSEDQTTAVIFSSNLKVEMNVVKDGVDMILTVTNTSEHDWPDIAAIIPCFNPGAPDHRKEQFPQAKLNHQFSNTNTWFVGMAGLEKQFKREIHFNEKLQNSLDHISPDGKFVFSEKWPTSGNAKHGILIRESTNKQWITGIAWERFLSVQGHNPWQCMHLGIQVGPLESGESKTIRGKIYLFEGSKEDCFEKYVKDFE